MRREYKREIEREGILSSHKSCFVIFLQVDGDAAGQVLPGLMKDYASPVGQVSILVAVNGAIDHAHLISMPRDRVGEQCDLK